MVLSTSILTACLSRCLTLGIAGDLLSSLTGLALATSRYSESLSPAPSGMYLSLTGRCFCASEIEVARGTVSWAVKGSEDLNVAGNQW